MTVDRVEAAVLTVMKAGKAMDFNARTAFLQPVLSAAFDTDFIARLVLGKHWQGLDMTERTRFVELLKRLLVASYAAGIGGFNDHRFTDEGTKAMRRGRMRVRTRITKASGDVDQLDYWLHQTAQGWRIINVIADGVSDLAVKRVEYPKIVATGGFTGLAERIEGQIADYGRG
jgi:phospholipid transport system substrate-binding protein